MTISQLVAESGAQMRVFDMGRSISKIGRKDFEAFENLAKPYPSPYLRHAWLGILSWNPKQAGQHNIWFLKLPLDEQNILQPGPRDAFLQHWLRVVTHPGQEHGEAPCSYKPDASRMAYFHALALRQLGQPATQYYATARAYLSGDNDFSQWQHLGLQGLAEVVARLDEEHNGELIASALKQMPAVPRNALLGFLENASVDAPLTNALNDALAEVMAGVPGAGDLAAFVRGLSGSVSVDQRQQLLDLMMLHPAAADVEVISALGSRCWKDLEGPRLHNYLELLAALGDQVFSALIADLMTLPGMRSRILEAFRNPQRSEKLGSAIGQLMALTRGQTQ